MAITTYSELQSAITNWLGGRSDIAAARITECIALFEASANRRLRVQQMETATALTPSGGGVGIPADYLAIREIAQSASPFTTLEYAEPRWLDARFPGYPTGSGVYYTIVAGGISVYPQDDTVLNVVYFQKIAALSIIDTTNWLLTAHPDLYLFGSLCELELFLGNDNRAPLWIQRRDAIYDEIEKLNNRTRYNSGAGIQIMNATP